MIRSLSAIVALTATSLLGAQGATYAPGYALSQVNSNNIYPHATSQMRYQQIHDAWSFTSQIPALIRGVTFRPSNQSSYVNRAAAMVELQVEMGLAATGVTSTNGGLTMDNNFDTATRKVVMKRKQVNYPSSGANVEELKIFDIQFKFDAASVFIYQPLLGRSLVVELRQYNRSGGYAWDFVSSTAVAGNGWSVQNGSYDGCPSKGNKVPSFEGDGANLKVGGTLSFKGTYDAANIPALMSLSPQAVSATLPGTTCQLMNGLDWIASGVTNSSNEFTVSFPVPNDPKLQDIRFYTQMFFFEPGANPLGLVASRSLYNGVGRGSSWTTMGIARIYGRATNPDTVTTAQSNFKNGLVIRFDR